MRLVYWDACCFLAFLQDEVDNADLCRAVLDEAERGRTRLLTSALTIAEVLALRGGLPIPADRRQTVEDFFKQPYIAVRSVTRRTAETAREYVWEHRIAPKDAIHVATAVEARVDDLHTFDSGLIAQSGKHGNPLLRIRKPHVDQASFDLPPPS